MSFVLLGSAGLLPATGVLLLAGLVTFSQDRPIKIRFTRFQKDDAGQNVAMFEFANSSPKQLSIRVPGVDFDGRGGVGTLVFTLDGGTCTHVLVPVPTNNSRLKIRASYLTTPALFRRWDIISWLSRRLNLTLTNSEFAFAPAVVGPAVERPPNPLGDKGYHEVIDDNR